MKRALMPVVFAGLVACQKAPPQQQAQAPAGPPKGSPEWKIQNAMSAAPETIAKNATIIDWPASPTEQPAQLRAGTNGWTCLPDAPETPANDPGCYDKVWMAWADAWMAHKPFSTKVAGISYMLQGSADASNTDPFKEQPDSGQSWLVDPPHIMLLLPDPRQLDAFPSEHTPEAGPYVMWKGTPYAHVMIPIK
jgi:hypothetical protein